MRDFLKKCAAFFTACTKNPKTSGSGAALIAGGISMIVHNPASALTAVPWVAIFAGFAALNSLDQRTSAPADPAVKS